MMIGPRYAGPTILSVEGRLGDQLEPFTRQRRRMQEMLAGLSDEQWSTPSRCDGWTVRDVAAHVAGVNQFWRASIRSGLGGTPTRFLVGFDPVATPATMVEQMTTLTPGEVLVQFVASNDALLAVVADLTDAGWSMTAESPAGHVPIRLVVQHALWDCWIHERDIAIPLGLTGATETDELTSCLQYAAAVSPVLGLGVDRAYTGTFAVAATDPDIGFVIDVDESVALRIAARADGVPTLRGGAVALIESLSLRAPMPDTAPPEWTRLVSGLATAFDAPRPT